MEKYVLGIDLGTSAVKVSAVAQDGIIIAQTSSSFAVSHPQTGFSEQDPNLWVEGTSNAIKALLQSSTIQAKQIEGLSFSGQMHGLVLLNKQNQILRPAILWDDTRTTSQCQEIMQKMGQRFIDITYNKPLEGFTLPKLLWVQEHEPEIWQQAKLFLLPKDYLRYQITGNLATDYSDATGTVMIDAQKQTWSSEICQTFNIPLSMCPPLIPSTAFTGFITPAFAQKTGLKTTTKTFAGAADNAAGAIGAGILKPNMVLSSIGTSGVILKYETGKTNYQGKLQFESHGIPNSYYSMGVTLAAGDSFNWFKQTFYPNNSFEDMTADAQQSTLGADGLLFTPYLVGERTPYANSQIRGSFIGIDRNHKKQDFVRAVMEGITFSLQDLLDIYTQNNCQFDTVVSIGGGAKSQLWLQMQADIFNKKVVCLTTEQGPGLGAAMIAAVGLKWFDSFNSCANTFIHLNQSYTPQPDNVQQYQALHQIYQEVYPQTKKISQELLQFKN